VTVTAPVAGTQVWLHRFPDLLKESAAIGPDWLTALRQEGMARFAASGVPGSREEDWRFTNMAVVARTPWQPSPVDAPEAAALEVRRLLAGSGQGPCMVLVNGRPAPELSTVDGLPDGVIFTSLSSALENCPDLVRQAIEKATAAGGHVLADLNTAFFEDGIFLSVPAGKLMEAPLRIISVQASTDEPAAIHPRLVLAAGEGSQATVVEMHAGAGEGPRLSNGVTDVAVAQGAVLTHIKVEQDGPGGTHVGMTRVHQDRDSRYVSLSLSLGSDLARNDLLVCLDGEGAECQLDGLYPLAGSSHVDHHTVIEHARPHTASSQLYKGVLDEQARGVFAGRVVVRPDAQKVQARQTNNNLLLSDTALAHSTPQLEIHADDVQCFHGSTMGQLDDDMLFYLRSRGIAGDRAREVLTMAFANAILERVPVPALRRSLEQQLFPEAQL
jgi:Fe-S cluster assembly protein SufD